MFPVEPISAKMLDYYVGRRDAFLIDLRSREEYRTGHMKGAVNLPYEEFEEMSEYDFPRERSWCCTATGEGQAFWRQECWQEMDMRPEL